MSGDVPAAAWDVAEPAYVACNDLLIAVQYVDILKATGLDSLDALFAASGEPLGKPGLDAWRERLRLTLDADGVSRTLYLKRFRNPPRRAMRALCGSGSGASSLGGVEWMWMQRLGRDGIPCPPPVALGQELSGVREVRSVVVSAAVPGDALERQLPRWRGRDDSRIRGLLEPLADLVARFHGLGYVHRDLYLSHVFCDPDVVPERSLHLIDLQRVMRPRLWRQRWVVKDLASLNYSAPADQVSTTDRVRWLKRYLGTSKLEGRGKRLVRRIVGKTRRIGAHDRRRAARLESGSSSR